MLIWPAGLVPAVMACVALTAPGAAGSVDPTLGGHWTLDEVQGNTAFDSSDNHNDGTAFNVTQDGTGYAFNGVNSRVVVPSSPSLNPGFNDFSYRVALVMDEPPQPVGETYDVLRKGLVTTRGGDYKFEVKNVKGKAIARCVVKSVRANGTKVLAFITDGLNLANGFLHVVTCTKTSTSITIRVDSRTPRTKTISGGLGSVSNTSDLALGAKAESTATTGFDWFEGVISDAVVASP